ncbi:MAG: amino acid ABC transporter substrate-binding protein [Alphaproteobacteria bacterium]|nr:amino acid ABC transporter substrate-binding protein [Alphaproteobacteria bacterium]
MSLKKLLGIALVALALVAAPQIRPAQAAGELQEIIKRGTIRIGWINSPPNSMKDPRTGELSGTYIDGAKEMVSQMGLKVEWVETTWGTFVAGLQSGQMDFCIAGTFATLKRALAVDFTKPIFYIGYAAVVAKDEARFKSIEDLNREGIKIAVVQGGAAEDFAKRNMPKAQLVSLATGNLTAPFIEVASGRADAGFEDVNTATHFVAQQPSVKNLFPDKPFNFLPIAWTARKGNQELISLFNVGIDAMMTSGRWAELAKPYAARGRFIDAPQYRVFGE